MKLTNKQIKKRSQLVEDAIQYFMNGFNPTTSTRNCLSREEAENKVYYLLSDQKNTKIFNAMAVSFSK